MLIKRLYYDCITLFILENLLLLMSVVVKLKEYRYKNGFITKKSMYFFNIDILK